MKFEDLAKQSEAPLGIPELDALQASYKAVGIDRPIYYRFLYKIAPSLSNFIELGCRTGHASYHVLKGNADITAYGVDKRTVVDKMVLSHPRFVFKNCLTLDPELLALFPEASLDAVMIDSSHKYEPTKQEFNAWWPKIKVGGLLLMDDILHEPYGCARFWKEIEKPKFAYESLHPQGWGFGIIQKSS